MASPTCMGRFERLHLTVVQNPAVLEELNQLFQKAVGDPNAYPSYHAPTLIYVCNSLEDEEGHPAHPLQERSVPADKISTNRI